MEGDAPQLEVPATLMRLLDRVAAVCKDTPRLLEEAEEGLDELVELLEARQFELQARPAAPWSGCPLAGRALRGKPVDRDVRCITVANKGNIYNVKDKLFWAGPWRCAAQEAAKEEEYKRKHMGHAEMDHLREAIVHNAAGRRQETQEREKGGELRRSASKETINGMDACNVYLRCCLFIWRSRVQPLQLGSHTPSRSQIYSFLRRGSGHGRRGLH